MPAYGPGSPAPVPPVVPVPRPPAEGLRAADVGELRFIGQLDRILGPLSEGAVTEGDWGSVLISVQHSLRPRFRSATSLNEGGKAAAPQLPAKLKFDYGSNVTERRGAVTKIAVPGTHCHRALRGKPKFDF